MVKKVTGNVGGDLNIESKQDKNSYEEKELFCWLWYRYMPVGDKDSAKKSVSLVVQAKAKLTANTKA